MVRLLPLLYAATSLSTWALTQQEIDQLIRKTTQNLTASLERNTQYGYMRYAERKEFTSDGQLKSSTLR